MKLRSLARIFCFCLSITSIYGYFDGQFSCAWGKSKGRSKRGAIDFFASSSISRKDIKFILYKKEQNDRGFSPIQILMGNSDSLNYADFDRNKLTKIFIHGYKSHKDKSAARLIREGYFKNDDFNVIVVDWSAAQYRFRVLWPYEAVVKKLSAVGQLTSDMIIFLEDNGLNLANTTVVGHSLGAHVAGVAGHNLDGRIGRIVGLDPAGPLMFTKHENDRLTKDDAMQVEVIHTEIDQCGLNIQMGHYDIYPNSGHDQPGCSTFQCSHARSYRFFAESLDPQSMGFFARECEDWLSMQRGNCNGEEILMGGLSTKSAPEGLYYVKTNADSPYAQGRT